MNTSADLLELAGRVESVAEAIGFALLEVEEGTLAHGLTLEEWKTLARAACTAMHEWVDRNMVEREATAKIADQHAAEAAVAVEDLIGDSGAQSVAAGRHIAALSIAKAIRASSALAAQQTGAA